MAQPTGTVENSSVLIINHPPSSVMRDCSFYTHWTTQCHSKCGWEIKPNSLPSKCTKSRHGLEFIMAHRCKKRDRERKKKNPSTDGHMHIGPHNIHHSHTHTHRVPFTYTDLSTSQSPSSKKKTVACE